MAKRKRRTKRQQALAVAKEFENKLEVGSVYSVKHKRKGAFVGLLYDIKKTPASDESDAIMLGFRLDVRLGSGQEQLAGAAGKLGKETTKEFYARPKLITEISKLEGEKWRRPIKLPEPEPEPEPEPDPTFSDKVRKAFGRSA